MLYFLADAFTRTFGITQPTEKTRRQTAFFILGLLLLLLAGLVIAFAVLHSLIR